MPDGPDGAEEVYPGRRGGEFVQPTAGERKVFFMQRGVRSWRKPDPKM